MLAFLHMLDLFMHKLSGLCGRRFSFAGVLLRFFKSFFFRHTNLSLRPECNFETAKSSIGQACAEYYREETISMKAFKSVLGGVAVLLGVITVVVAIPDIARYIRISRM